MDWISVNIRLPNDESSCIVRYENGAKGESKFWSKEEGFDAYADPLHIMVTHWKYAHDYKYKDSVMQCCENCYMIRFHRGIKTQYAIFSKHIREELPCDKQQQLSIKKII